MKVRSTILDFYNGDFTIESVKTTKLFLHNGRLIIFDSTGINAYTIKCLKGSWIVSSVQLCSSEGNIFLMPAYESDNTTIPPEISSDAIFERINDYCNSSNMLTDLDDICVSINESFIDYFVNSTGYSDIGGEILRTYIYKDQSDNIIVDQKIIGVL